MLIQVISDIHTEMARDAGEKLIKSMKPEGIDLLVLAGDILSLANFERAKTTINFFVEKGYKKIFYVPGNHDYWHTNLKDGGDVANRLQDAFPGIFEYFYTGKIITLNGHRFLGDTMWFEMAPDFWRRKSLQRGFPDFSMIAGADPQCYEEFTKFRKFLDNELKEGDIVITHHLPSYKSTPDRFVGDPMNIFFNVNLESIILSKSPALWIHGHTHDFFDYKIGKTRIVCNPQDYPMLAPPPAKHFEIEI